MLNRTMHYRVNVVTVSDDTADAWERFMLYKDAQERAMSTIVVECLAVSLISLLLGTYVATTTKIITA